MPLMTSQSQIKGVSQSSTPAVVPEGSLWYDTTANRLKASDGSTYSNVGTSSFAGAAVVSHSTTIGDYTAPTSAVASSTGAGVALFSDDFTSYADTTEGDAAYPTSDTTNLRVNPTTDLINVTVTTSSPDANIYKDLTSISTTVWRLRFKWVITAITHNTTGNGKYQTIVMSSSNGAPSASQDAIGIRIADYDVSDKKIEAFFTNGAALSAGTTAVFSTAASATTFYVEIKRLSDTSATVELFSDSGYTTSIESESLTIGAGLVTGLRYINITAGGGATDGTLTTTLDDIAVTHTAPAAAVYDTLTTTYWKTNSENNPNIYVDMGSTLNLCAIALYYNGTDTTETEIKIQSSIDAVTWTDKRKITTSNLTSGAWNYYRFNIAGGARYVRAYGTSNSKVLSFYEIKVLKKTDAEIFADMGIVEISSSDTSLDSDGV